MRKAKRIIALVLALTMMFALVAMTTSAATPRANSCKFCSSTNTTAQTSWTDTYNEYVGGCQKLSIAHTHVHREYTTTLTCRNCGRSYVISTYWTTTCE